MYCISSPAQADSANPDLPTLWLFLLWASLHQAASLAHKTKFCCAVKCLLKAKKSSVSFFYTRGPNPAPKVHIKKLWTEFV